MRLYQLMYSLSVVNTSVMLYLVTKENYYIYVFLGAIILNNVVLNAISQAISRGLGYGVGLWLGIAASVALPAAAVGREALQEIATNTSQSTTMNQPISNFSEPEETPIPALEQTPAPPAPVPAPASTPASEPAPASVPASALSQEQARKIIELINKIPTSLDKILGGETKNAKAPASASGKQAGQSRSGDLSSGNGASR